jgi:hypothetical protein
MKTAKELIEELQKTTKEINFLMTNLSIEERVKNKPESLIVLSTKKKNLLKALVEFSNKKPISKDLVKGIASNDLKTMINNGLMIETELQILKLSENDIEPIMNHFKSNFDISLFMEEILLSLKNNEIYQDIFDLKGKYPLSIDELRDIDSLYELIIRFKLIKEISKSVNILFPKIYDPNLYEAFFYKHIIQNTVFEEIFDVIYNDIKKEDSERYEKTKSEKVIKQNKLLNEMLGSSFEDFWNQIIKNKKP